MTTITIHESIVQEIVSIRLRRMSTDAQHSTAFWRTHDDTQFAKSNGAEVVDNTTADEKIYTLIAKISASDKSDLWSAVEGSFEDEELQRTTSTLALKIFKKLPTETAQQAHTRAQEEYLLTSFIDDFGKKNRRDAPCGRDFLCAQSFFATPDFGDVAVFAFPNALGLQEFLKNKFYNLFDANQEEYKLEALNIAILLFEAVFRMNGSGVFHGDIHPDNIIVSWEKGSGKVPHVVQLRLINVEGSHSCVAASDLQKQLMEEKGLQRFSCTKAVPSSRAIFYSPTARFRDPLAGDPTKKDQGLPLKTEPAELRVAFAYSEMFACALVAQLLFDREQNKPGVVPKLQHTARSVEVVLPPAEVAKGKKGTDHVLQILKQMTGPLRARENLAILAANLEEIAKAILRGTIK